MARLVVAAVVGVAVGYFSGDPYLGVQAFTLTYGLSAGLDPNKKVLGPKLNDLKAPSASYGVPIAYIEGAPRLAGNVVWASAKREVATTTTTGKGGPGVDSTAFTYEMDMLIVLSINRLQAVTRIWSNGKLIWGRSADADINTLIASDQATAWRDIRFYFGGPDQLPDPTYEAAVGVGNAPAYRGRTTVFIEGVNLGGSGQLPVFTFEACSEVEPHSINDQLGTILNHIYYNTSSIFVGPSGEATAHIAYRGNSESTDIVVVRRLNADGTNEDIATYHTQQSGRPIGELDSVPANTGRGTIDEPAGVFFANNNYVPSGRATVFDASGGRKIDVTFTGDTTGTFPIFTLYQDVLYLTGQNSNTLVRRIVAGGISATADPGFGVWTMARVGDSLWVKERTATVMHRMDAQTLELDPTTEPLPNAGTDGFNGNTLISNDGRLYFAIRGTVDGKLFRYEGAGTWTLINDNLGDAAPNNSQGESEGMVGEVFYRYSGTSTDYHGPVYRSGATFSPKEIPLPDVVERLCINTGQLVADDVDVSELDGVVRAMAISQVSNARVTLETLMSCYLFEGVEGERIRFVPRGGMSVMTVPYTDLGTAPEGDAEPLPKKRVSDVEVAARVSVKYANVLNDFQDGLESADRLVTASTSEAVVEVPLGLRPSEAKRLADSNTLDLAVGLLQIGPISLPRKYAALEPTDVITLTDADGSTFRARIIKGTIGGGIYTFELVLDDATVVNSAAETDDNYVSTSLLRLLLDTKLALLNLPVLRSEDDNAGFYAAFGANGPWPGAELQRSPDDVTFASVLTANRRGIVGSCSDTLPAWSGGNLRDDSSTLTVNVGDSTLSSSTDEAMLLDTVNFAAVGSYTHGFEIVQYLNAALQSPGVYKLSGFWRGLRGSEPLSAAHDASELFIPLDPDLLYHLPDDATNIGVLAHWKAITLGRRVSVPSVPFANDGTALRPFAPVGVHVRETQTGNVEIVWDRRSRALYRLFDTVPLDEATESYRVTIEKLVGGSYVLARSKTVSTPICTYTAAEQLVDGVVRLQSIRASVQQISAVVGAGYASALAYGLGTHLVSPQISTITLGGTFASGVPLYVVRNGIRTDYTVTGGDASLAGAASSLRGVLDTAWPDDYTLTASGATITATGPASVAFDLAVGEADSGPLTSGVIVQYAEAASLGGRMKIRPTGYIIGADAGLGPGVRFHWAFTRGDRTVNYSFTTTADYTAADIVALATLAFSAPPIETGTPGTALDVSFPAGSMPVVTFPLGQNDWVGSAPYHGFGFLVLGTEVIDTGAPLVPVALPQITDLLLTGTDNAAAAPDGRVFRARLTTSHYDHTVSGGETYGDVMTALATAINAAAPIPQRSNVSLYPDGPGTTPAGYTGQITIRLNRGRDIYSTDRWIQYVYEWTASDGYTWGQVASFVFSSGTVTTSDGMSAGLFIDTVGGAPQITFPDQGFWFAEGTFTTPGLSLYSAIVDYPQDFTAAAVTSPPGLRITGQPAIGFAPTELGLAPSTLTISAALVQPAS